MHVEQLPWCLPSLVLVAQVIFLLKLRQVGGHTVTDTTHHCSYAAAITGPRHDAHQCWCSVCLSVCMCVCLSACLSVCLGGGLWGSYVVDKVERWWQFTTFAVSGVSSASSPAADCLPAGDSLYWGADTTRHRLSRLSGRGQTSSNVRGSARSTADSDQRPRPAST